MSVASPMSLAAFRTRSLMASRLARKASMLMLGMSPNVSGVGMVSLGRVGGTGRLGGAGAPSPWRARR